MRILKLSFLVLAAFGLVLLLSGLAAAQIIAIDDHDKYFAASNGESTEIWDMTSGTKIASAQGSFAGFSANGAQFANTIFATDQNVTRVWTSGKPDALGSFDGDFVALSKDGKWLITNHPKGGVRLWDATSGATVRTLVAGPLEHAAIAVSPDFSRLAVHRPGAKEVDIITVSDAKVEHSVPLGPHPGIDDLADITDSMAISSDGKLIAYSYGNEWDFHRILVADAVTGKQVANFKATMGHTPDVQFDPSGTMIISDGNTVDLWNARTGKRVRTFNLTPILYHVAEWGTSSEISRDGKLLAVSGPEDRTMMFNFATGREVRWFRSGKPQGYQFTSTGDSIIIIDANGVVNLRNAATGKLIRQLAKTGIKS